MKQSRKKQQISAISAKTLTQTSFNQNISKEESPSAAPVSGSQSTSLKQKAPSGQMIQVNQLCSGTRKFIDLTDPQFTQNKSKLGSKYPVKDSKVQSPTLDANKKTKEASLSQKLVKIQTKTKLNRSSSAVQRDELTKRLPRAISPRLSTAIKGFINTTRGRNIHGSASQNKIPAMHSVIQSNKQIVGDDIPKKIPHQSHMMITASRSLATLNILKDQQMPLIGDNKEIELEQQNSDGLEATFLNQLGLKGRARVKSLQVLPPTGKAISPNTSKKLQINIAEEQKSTNPTNEKPTYTRVKNQKNSTQILKKQQFLTLNDEKYSGKTIQKVQEALNQKNQPQVQIFVRIRPSAISSKENDHNSCIDQVHSSNDGKLITVKNGITEASFKFKNIFTESFTQEEVYNLSCGQLVQSFIRESLNGIIFAYGETGAGKTFTVVGGETDEFSLNSSLSSSQQAKSRMVNFNLAKNINRGIIPRIIDQLFNQENQYKDYTFFISYFEIFGEKVFDLLQPISIHSLTSTPSSDSQQLSQSTLRTHRQDTLEVIEGKNGSFQIPELKRIEVKSKSDAYALLELGLQSRKVRSTLTNICSSESHSIFQIETNSKSSSLLRIVDLAGSEKGNRQKKRNQKLQELAQINQSLQTLGQCISAIGQTKTTETQNIPFRNCKLTQVLKDSLFQPGMMKKQILVQLILCISPSIENYAETQATLQFTCPSVQLTQTKTYPEATKNISNEQVSQIINELEQLKSQNRDLQEQVQIYQKLSLSKQSINENNFQSKEKTKLAHLPLFEKNQLIIKIHEKPQARPSSIFQEQPKPDAGIDATISLEDIREEQPLKSCLKQDRKQEQKNVQFKEKLLDNDQSLNSSIRERVEHNLKYNDDTIFANLDIFKDIGEVSHKVHGKKDKFNASSLLAVRFQDIPVSEDEQNGEYQNDMFEAKPSFKGDESLSMIKNNNEYDSILESLKRPDLLKGLDSINVENTNMSAQISQELLDLNQDKQFQQACNEIVQNLNDAGIENQNNSTKIFGSLLDPEEGEESNSNILFYSNRNIKKDMSDQQLNKTSQLEQNNSNQEQRPFLDELSNIMYRAEFENNFTNVALNDEAPAIQRQLEQQQSYFLDQQQQSTLILDEEEVGAAQSHGVFDQDDNVPVSEGQRLQQNYGSQSAFPSFDASRILPVQQNDQSAIIAENKNNDLFQRTLIKKSEQQREEQKDINNESEDCNLTIGDKPSFLIRGLGGIVNQKQRRQSLILGGVSEKILMKTQEESKEVEQDVTKLANECSRDLPSVKQPEQQISYNKQITDEMLTFSLTKTYSTVQSLSSELQVYAQTIHQRRNENPDSLKIIQDNHEKLNLLENLEYGASKLNESILSQSQQIKEYPSQRTQSLNSETVTKKVERESQKQKSHSVETGEQTDKDVDIKTFTSDLEVYYKKIHGEIAQLKNILAELNSRKLDNQPNFGQPQLQEQVLFTSALSGKQTADLLPQMKQKLQKFDKSVIIRSQYLIEKIKKEIISSLKLRNYSSQTSQEMNLLIQHSDFTQKPIHSATITQIPAANIQNQELKNNFFRFQGRIKDPKDAKDPIEAFEYEKTSLKVIQLLEQLETELLMSLIKLPQKADPFKLKTHLSSLSMNQFEEIEGSQERSPHLIRHMEIQRQITQKNGSEIEGKMFREFQKRVSKNKLQKLQKGNNIVQTKSSQEVDFAMGQFDPQKQRQQKRYFKKQSLIGQGSQSVSDSQVFNIQPRVSNAQEQKKDVTLNKQSQYEANKIQFNAYNQAFDQQNGLAKSQVNVKVHSANRLCGTPELKKKTLSDSTVNMTYTSGAFLIDQSQNISHVMNTVPKTQEKPALGQIFQRNQLKCLSSSALRSDSLHNTGGGSFVALPHQSNLVGASLGSFGNTLEGHKRTSTIQNSQSKSASSLKQSMLCSNQKSRISASFGGRDYSNNGSNAAPNLREGSDQTLTLIFDSDEEPIVENQSLQQTAAKAKSKILSEIVEDYFNESNQIQADQKYKKKDSQKAEATQQKRHKSALKNQKYEQEKDLNFSYKKADTSLTNQIAVNEQDYLNQQNFMNEQSILNLFQDPIGAEQNSSKQKIQRNSSASSKVSNNYSFTKDSMLKEEMKIDLPYQDKQDFQKLNKSRKSSLSSAENTKSKEKVVTNQFSSMFKKANEAPKKSSWAAPPRIQTLKSKKKKLYQIEAQEEIVQPIKVNTSHLSEILHLDENSQEFQEDSKHNTSKQSMQKYLLQFFHRKGDENAL